MNTLDWEHGWLPALLIVLAHLAVWGGAFLVILVVFQSIYWALSAPLRRQERARFFLDLLENGATQGRSFEQAIVSSANTRDPSLGVYFHLLAAYVEAGHRLESALAKVPAFLPRRLNALFQASQELGDLRKVIPLGRKILQDGASKAQAGQNSMGVVLFGMPVGALVVVVFAIWVFPRLREIGMDMAGHFPVNSQRALDWSIRIAWVTTTIWLLFWLGTALQSSGPRLLAWVEKFFWPLFHGFELLLPWQRKRLKRDFSAMLALYLDSGMPEEKALQLAAQGTGNRYFMTRAQEAIQALRSGMKITEAVQRLDRTGEFRWRLENAAAAQRGFAAALAGWQESLDGKAYAQEQAASQLVTTGLVFLNGLMVLLIAGGLLQMLLAILEEAALW